MVSGKRLSLWVGGGLCLVVTSLAAVTAVGAQHVVDTTKAHHLTEVVVVGQRTPADIIPVQSLSGAALQRLSVHSVSDALRYFSGVQIKDYGGVGGLKTVNIRSLGTNHVGIFYDGIQLGNAQNGQIDLGRFAPDNMEALSLYNGQKSAIFQPAKDFAAASAIYMTSRRPVFEEGKYNNFTVKFKTGSFDLLNLSALWEHRWSKHIKGSVNVEQLYTSGKYKFRTAKRNGYDTTEVRQNGDVTMLRAEAALFGDIRNGDWKVRAYFYNSERGYPGAAVREAEDFQHVGRQWDDNFFLQSSLQKHFSTFYSLLLNGKYAYDYLRYFEDPHLNRGTMYVHNHYYQQETYLSSAHEFTFYEAWSANLACDFQFNTLDADLPEFVYPRRYAVLTAAATSLRLAAFHIQASVLHTYVHDETSVENASADVRSVFTPTVAASYKPWQQTDLTFRAFYKRVFRLPTFNDLYYTFIGNKFLKPEYTTQYNVGVTYSHNLESRWLQQFGVQVDAYYNEVEDKIVAIPADNQFRWTMLNFGYVEIRGIDVALHGQWQAGNVHGGARLSYTYQKAQDFTNPASEWYGHQISYIPWHSGSAIVNATWKMFDFNYSFIYTGERYSRAANIAENYSPAWYTHDFSASWNGKLCGAALTVTAEVNNIFNQPYEVVQWYPMPGTNFKLILKVTV